MFKSKKVESEARKPKNLLLRLFRPSDIPQGSLVSLKSTDQEDPHTYNSKAVRNAMLEANYQNAEALLAFRMSDRVR